MKTRFTPVALAALLLFALTAPAALLVPVLRAREPDPVPQRKTASTAAKGAAEVLSYSDGTAENKRSIAGAGEMVSFTLPNPQAKVAGIRLHGVRYGAPRPPKENFMIYFLSEDMTEVEVTKSAPYSRFKRGEPGWVDIKFPKPVEVSEKFWVCVDFRAAPTKGVYLSFDDSTGGEHSRIGLPGMGSRPANLGGDWMIEVILAK